MKPRALLMDRSGGIGPFSSGGAEPETGRPLILLVHGYNNDPVQAAESYFNMRCNLDNLLRWNETGEAVRKEFQGRMWEFYWPGYEFGHSTTSGSLPARRSGFERAASAFSYSQQVGKASKLVPDALTSYLSRRAPSEVFFIAHSLGCRVVLETVSQLAASLKTGVRLAGFLLMAAAVPVNILGVTGSLGPGALQARRRYCLHSWRDTVLMLAFPPGQILAGEAPPYGLPVASGLTGAPGLLWSRHASTRLNHGGYWSEGLFKGGSALSELCAGIFGVAVRREIQLSRLPRADLAARMSILPENQLASGRLRGTDWLRDYYGPGN